MRGRRRCSTSPHKETLALLAVCLRSAAPLTRPRLHTPPAHRQYGSPRRHHRDQRPHNAHDLGSIFPVAPRMPTPSGNSSGEGGPCPSPGKNLAAPDNDLGHLPGCRVEVLPGRHRRYLLRLGSGKRDGAENVTLLLPVPVQRHYSLLLTCQFRVIPGLPEAWAPNIKISSNSANSIGKGEIPGSCITDMSHRDEHILPG